MIGEDMGSSVTGTNDDSIEGGRECQTRRGDQMLKGDRRIPAEAPAFGVTRTGELLAVLPSVRCKLPHARDPKIVGSVLGRSQSTRRSVAALTVGRCLWTSLLR